MAQYLKLCPSDVQVNYLGGGTDGDVWKTSRDTAIKVLHREIGYYNEKDSYIRLTEFGYTREIAGFWVPQILDCDDRLMVVEMDLMHAPPYIIDFAKVKLNTPPNFSDDVLQQQEMDGLERFEHNWKAVKRLLRELETCLIYYLDPQRGNITFPDMP
jgi:hypothetical protein